MRIAFVILILFYIRLLSFGIGHNKNVLSGKRLIEDTTINVNSVLSLEYNFPEFTCGISIFKHPIHSNTSILEYNNTLDTAVYTYIPNKDFIGIDTVIFEKGCGSDEYSHIDTIYYIIHIENISGILSKEIYENNKGIYYQNGLIILSEEFKALEIEELFIYNVSGQLIRKLKVDKCKSVFEFHTNYKGLIIIAAIKNGIPINCSKIQIQ